MLNSYNHPFHLVTSSPWPFITSFSIFNLLLNTIQFIHLKIQMWMIISLTILIICTFQWWRDVIRESTFQGFHTKMVQSLHRSGMILFIISEIFFFISLFWAFYHSALAPNIDIGSMWPPKGIKTLSPYSIPLLNTIILLTSGFSVTWCHNSIINMKYKEAITSLKITIFLGLLFSSLQLYEYKTSGFSINDNIYGSTFYMATGFHGIHVIIGTLFLSVSLYRLSKNQFSKSHHLGFEMAAWYWHFVDFVWLLLFMSIYWWPN